MTLKTKIPFPEYHLFQILRRFEAQRLPLDLFLSTYFRNHHALGSKDRQWIAETVYGMTRWRGLLDYLIEGHPSWEKRLELFKKHPFSLNRAMPDAVRVSCPEPLWDRLVQDYGKERAFQLARAFNTEAPITIRVNPLKTTREELLRRWEGVYEVRPTLHSPYGIIFNKRAPLVAMQEFRDGLFEIQDEGSQLVAFLMNAQPKQHLLDYCAGAGGKTLAFAPLMHNQGQVYLHDIRAGALDQARKRLKRAGIQNVQFVLPQSQKMDGVLVDVPCSGTGTLRRNPDQKWKFGGLDLEKLLAEQRKIFGEALAFVKPGGRIVYATCSILREENEGQMEYFLGQHPVEGVGEVFQSLPEEGGMDGFFAAVFKKR